MESVKVDDVVEAIEAGDNSGFCIACGAQHWGIEPDARGYDCERCGEPEVFGAEECLLMLA